MKIKKTSNAKFVTSHLDIKVILVVTSIQSIKIRKTSNAKFVTSHSAKKFN